MAGPALASSTQPQRKGLFRRAFVLFGLTLGWLVVGLVLLLALALVGLSTGPGKRVFVGLVERVEVGGQSVRLTGLRGDLFSRFTLDQLTLEDAQGAWARLDGLVVNWSAGQLLAGHLQVDALTVQSLAVTRRPAWQSRAERSPTRPWITAYSLERVRIDRIHLEPAVVPRFVDSRLEGGGAWTGDQGRLAARLAPLSDPGATGGDQAELALTFTRLALISGQARIDAPSGGLIATLLRLAPGSGLVARLETTGETDALGTTFSADIDGKNWLDLTLSREGKVGEAGAQSGIGFDGGVDLSRHPLSAAWVGMLGNRLDLTGRFDPGSGAEALTLVATSDKGEIALLSQAPEPDPAASRPLNGGSVLRTQISLQDASIGDKNMVSFDRFTADGVLFGPVSALDWQGEFTMQGLRSAGARLDRSAGQIGLTRTESGLSYDADLVMQGLALPGTPSALFAPALAIVSQGAFDAGNNALLLQGLSAKSSVGTLTAQGRVALDGLWSSTLNGALTARTPPRGVSGFGPLSSGQVSARWSLAPDTAQKGPSQALFSLTGQASNLGFSSPLLSRVIGPAARFSGAGTLSETHAIHLKRLEITTADLSLSGAAERSANGDLSGQVGLTTRRDARPFGPVDTPAASLRFEGPLSSLAFSGRIAAEALDLGGSAALSPNLIFSGKRLNNNTNFKASGGALVRDLPLNLNFEAGVGAEDWTLSSLQADWAGLRVTGQGSGPVTDLAGSRLILSATGQDMAPLGGGALKASLDWADGAGILTASLSGIRHGLADFDAFDLRLAGTTQALDYTVQIKGRTVLNGLYQPLELTLSGQAMNALSALRRITANLDGRWGDVAFSTAETAFLEGSARGETASMLLDLLGGQVKLQASPDSARLTTNALRLGPVFRTLGQPDVRGNLTLSAISDGPLARAFSADGAFRFEGNLADLRQPGIDADPVSLALEGKLEAGVLDARLNTLAPSALKASANVKIPFGSSHAPENAGISGQVDGRIDDLIAIFAPPRLAIEGDVDARFSMPWPISLVTATGQIIYSQGRFEDAALGAELKDIGFEASLKTGTFRLTRFEAKGGDKGSLTGEGTARIGAEGAAGAIELAARDLVVFDRREGFARASGTLGIAFAREGIDIVGDLQIHSARIDISRMPQSSEPTLEITFDDDRPDTRQAARQRVGFDIALRSTRGIEITGQGLQATASLDARVEGSLSKPEIFGTASLDRGRFDLLGKRFVFQPSTAQLAGDVMAAAFDLTATRQINGFEAIIEIAGTPRRPEVTLSSNPTVPSDEVLSRILFGRSPTQLSALETARLASAVLQLSGGQSFDLLGGLEKMTGLDTLEVDQTTTGQIQLTTGQYINDDTYVELKTTGAGLPVLGVTWQARENIVVEAETASDEGQSLTIRWVEEFD
jgi:translocation and assembly module TamB